MINMKLTNVLTKEFSPYLLQHAQNPVHWQVWNEETLSLAKKLSKPILISIGYSSCHWCHVMEKESFEDEEVAALMNDHFINIKIDREERPDLDQIYMDAVQLLTGSGGWPLNVFLTPEGKAFFGGTYFPPKKLGNRYSWTEILHYVINIWNNRKTEVENQAQALWHHMESVNDLIFKTPVHGDSAMLFSEGYFSGICEKLLNAACKLKGGFGSAPKFPQLLSIQYLIHYHHHYGNEMALNHALFSLKSILAGGIYDQLGGGMSRYSTDEYWLVPHFEKMLYDNALLITVLSEAYQITHDEGFQEAIQQTISFCETELKCPEGGYYTAIDADSEGEEGKFYVWNKKSIENILGEDAVLFCDWFGVTENGNWEKQNILFQNHSRDEFAQQNQLSSKELIEIIERAKEKLLIERNKRHRPSTDTKVLLVTNAMLVTAYCKAASALQNKDYEKKATALYQMILDNFSNEGSLFFHSTSTKKNQIAFLDDYAYLIQAAISLQEITGDSQLLMQAQRLTNFVLLNFQDEKSGLYYFTHKEINDVILRKSDILDSPFASGNAIMAENLIYLSMVFGSSDWKNQANLMLGKMKTLIEKHPMAYSKWASIAMNHHIGFLEIVITGSDIEKTVLNTLGYFIPNRVFQASKSQQDQFELLKNKKYGEGAQIQICSPIGCELPIEDIRESVHFHNGLTFNKKENQ